VVYSGFPNLHIKRSAERRAFLYLIQFAIQQVLWVRLHSCNTCLARIRSAVKLRKMADGSVENPPYAYGYHHPYYGHLYAGNTTGIAYPTWPQSLTAWSAGNHSPPFCDPVDVTETAPVSDEEGPTAATAGDCKSSSRKRKDDIPLSSASAGECRSSSKEDPTYSYLMKIIPPNNKKKAIVHEMYDVERRFESPDALKAQIIDSFGGKLWTVFK